MSGVRQQVVARDEDGMRLDRWFATHFPQVTFGHLQKLLRSGQIRVDSGRVKANARLAAGQVVRVPPIEAAPNKKGEAPRLVHRLDRDTSGCLVVAKTKAAAAHFGEVFSSRQARKIYWAVVWGNPHPKQGSISCFLAKQATTDGEQMVVVPQGTPGAQHSMSYYSTTDTAARRFAWVTLKPVTGRTHQLRVHMAQLHNPIMGDPRYFNIENWTPPDEISKGLHLHARRIRLPLRNGRRARLRCRPLRRAGPGPRTGLIKSPRAPDETSASRVHPVAAHSGRTGRCQ